jgi:hypothetical protein
MDTIGKTQDMVGTGAKYSTPLTNNKQDDAA